MIAFTIEGLVALKSAYNKAVEAEDAEFTFQGRVFLTTYAKYVIEYLDRKFGETK